MANIWRTSGGYGGYLADKSTHPLPDKDELNVIEEILNCCSKFV